MPNIVTLSILWQKGKPYGCSSGYIDRYFDRETEEREQKERERERERERENEWIRNLHVYFISYVPDCIYTHVCVKFLQLYQLESLQGRSHTPILSL